MPEDAPVTRAVLGSYMLGSIGSDGERHGHGHVEARLSPRFSKERTRRANVVGVPARR